MDESPTSEDNSKDRVGHSFSSLKDLLSFISAKTLSTTPAVDAGIAEPVPFPFLAIVGQREMKLALLLGLINPHIGGILLIGPRGTAKTTAVRSLFELLPTIHRSTCYYGCVPEDIETGGIDAVCPECAKNFAENHPLTAEDRVRLVELPLNAQLDDVVGGVQENSLLPERMRIRRGILSQADQNILFIDEINLLSNDIMDAILDAAAQGRYSVRRGPVSATYRSRFMLIGSMNPEEGNLRPQLQDRFGLRVIVRGLEESDDRLDAYRRVQAYLINPHSVSEAYGEETRIAAREIQEAKIYLPKVRIPDEIGRKAIELIKEMSIDSLRAEITWFEAARAYAAAGKRDRVTSEDLTILAPMALRLRRSKFMTDYLLNQQAEEDELKSLLKGID